jgi:prepilin-type processing-associated H-X9-DG protein
VNNQKQLGLALKVWALDSNDLLPMQLSITNGGTMERISAGTVFPHFQVLSNELSTPKILFCPADKERQAATNFTTSFNDAQISYFLNVDITNGSDVVVSTGDRNLTNKPLIGTSFVLITNNSRLIWDKRIHTEQANIGLADGSVLQVSNHRQNIIMLSEGETNRLAVP